MNRRGWLFIMAVCVGLVVAMPGMAAAEQLRAYLVHATNDAGSSDRELRGVEASLRQVFGYKLHRMMASDGADLRENSPMSLNLAKGISIQAVNTGTEDGIYTLDVTMKQGRTTLLTSKMRMSRDTPLLIRGPEMGQGLLIIVLFLR